MSQSLGFSLGTQIPARPFANDAPLLNPTAVPGRLVFPGLTPYAACGNKRAAAPWLGALGHADCAIGCNQQQPVLSWPFFTMPPNFSGMNVPVMPFPSMEFGYKARSLNCESDIPSKQMRMSEASFR